MRGTTAPNGEVNWETCGGFGFYEQDEEATACSYVELILLGERIKTYEPETPEPPTKAEQKVEDTAWKIFQLLILAQSELSVSSLTCLTRQAYPVVRAALDKLERLDLIVLATKSKLVFRKNPKRSR
jgi:hypothetical protein